MLKVYQNIKLPLTVLLTLFLVFVAGKIHANNRDVYFILTTSVFGDASLGHSVLDIYNNSILVTRYETDFDVGIDNFENLSLSLGIYVTERFAIESKYSLMSELEIKRGQFTSQSGEKLKNLANTEILVQNFSVAGIYDFYKNHGFVFQSGVSVGLLYFEDDMDSYEWLFEDDQIYYGFIARALYELNNSWALVLSYNVDYSRRLHDMHNLDNIFYRQDNYLKNYLKQAVDIGVRFKF